LVLQKIPFDFGGVMDKTKLVPLSKLFRGQYFRQSGKLYIVLQKRYGVITYANSYAYKRTGHWSNKKTINCKGSQLVEQVKIETISQTNKK